MNSIATAREGYAVSTRNMRTPRGIEYDAFARVTAGLRTAGRSGDFPALAAAVHENRRLWTLLAADLAEPGNQLPEALKARLLSLAGFSYDHGARVLEKSAPVDILVDINTAIMHGLSSEEGVQ